MREKSKLEDRSRHAGRGKTWVLWGKRGERKYNVQNRESEKEVKNSKNCKKG